MIGKNETENCDILVFDSFKQTNKQSSYILLQKILIFKYTNILENIIENLS